MTTATAAAAAAAKRHPIGAHQARRGAAQSPLASRQQI